jgi:hypothetical protein
VGIGEEQREEWVYVRSRGKKGKSGNRRGAKGRVGIGKEQREE